MNEEKQYSTFMDVTEGWISAPVKNYQNHPSGPKIPR